MKAAHTYHGYPVADVLREAVAIEASFPLGSLLQRISDHYHTDNECELTGLRRRHCRYVRQSLQPTEEEV